VHSSDHSRSGGNSTPVNTSRSEPVESLRSLIRSDLNELAKLKGTSTRSPLWWGDVLTLPGAWSAMLWRLGTWLNGRGVKVLSRLCYFANIVLFGAELHPGAEVGAGITTPHPVGLDISSEVQFGERCRVMGKVSVGGSGHPDKPGHPKIGDDVWLFDSAQVFGPVTIGDRSIIGARVTVTADIPPDSFVTMDAKMRIRTLAEVGLETHGGSLPPSKIAQLSGH
jgi:serine O-acetyltransferase